MKNENEVMRSANNEPTECSKNGETLTQVPLPEPYSHRCTGDFARCFDGNGCECELSGNGPLLVEYTADQVRAHREEYADARVAAETAALRAKLAEAEALVSRLGTSDQNIGSCVASSELHAACWEIRWPSTPEGFEEIKYHGANALQDYRDHVHPEARSREMVYKDEAIAYAAAKASQWEGVAGQAVSAEMAASLQAEQVERERDEARAEAERLRKDAERYALLRDSERCRELSGGRTGLILGNFDEDLDAEIDAAILAEHGGES